MKRGEATVRAQGRTQAGWVAIAAAIAASTVVWGSPAVAAPRSAPPLPDPAAVAESITAENVMRHLEQFEAIADASGGNRAVGTEGYTRTADYVDGLLTAAGYVTERQEFEIASQAILDYAVSINGVPTVPALGAPFGATMGTGPAGVEGTIVRPADLGGEGCRPDDWAGVDASGEIALVTVGSCSYLEKSIAAEMAGADALIVANTTGAVLRGEFSEQDPLTIPTIGVTGPQAASLAARPTDVLGITVDERTTRILSFNLLAESPTGREDTTVMAGAHLDSVAAGAGINDNGSGSAALLETALVLASRGELTNQVRFAWWGAEEIGLVGSINYAGDLLQNNPLELEQIVSYLNFDMIASPNHIMGVYDANQSTYAAPLAVPAGSEETERLFTDYFDAIGQPWVDVPFDGRSDYLGFLLTGVPSGGLFTGADSLKTEKEAAQFGGTVGLAHDPNYHTAADRVSNVDPAVLQVSARAIAYVVTTLALDSSFVTG